MPIEAPVLEPQFRTVEQQRAASQFGMWGFLATELLLFGSIYAANLMYRLWYPRDFEEASSHLNVLIGGINTVVLLTSSLTMALSVYYTETRQRRRLLLCLALTIFFGALFIALKGYEYYTDWRDGLVPRTGRFQALWNGPDSPANPRHIALFLMFYYIMTGLHAVHLSIGIGLVTWLIVRTARGSLWRSGAVVVDTVGLYWHFVDVVWIFLLPLLYLSGHHTLSDLHF